MSDTAPAPTTKEEDKGPPQDQKSTDTSMEEEGTTDTKSDAEIVSPTNGTDPKVKKEKESAPKAEEKDSEETKESASTDKKDNSEEAKKDDATADMETEPKPDDATADMETEPKPDDATADMETEPKPDDTKPEESESPKPKTPRKKRKGSITPIATPSSYTKRQRKSTTSFSPKNFKEDTQYKSNGVVIPRGRGTKLSNLPSVKLQIDKIQAKDPILHELHKFLFGGIGGILGKGRTSKKLLKKHVFEFSGYLPLEEDIVKAREEAKKLKEEEKESRKNEDGDEGENESEDEIEDEKDMATIEQEALDRFEDKAAALKIPLLKSFCDLLSVDRSPTKGKQPSKDNLINILLDFLAAPSEELLTSKKPTIKKPAVSTTTPKKRGRKPGSKNKPKKKKDEYEEDTEDEGDDEDENDEEIDGQTIPSEKKLKKWVKAYITCFSLDKATAKHAIETASDKFGVDMNTKKTRIMELLKEAMSG